MFSLQEIKVWSVFQAGTGRRHRLSGWLKEEAERPDKEFGIIVRTNAADASKEEILKELEWLKGRYHKAVVQGRNRTCFSLVLETEPFYVAAVRDAYGRDLDEIITDVTGNQRNDLGISGRDQPGA